MARRKNTLTRFFEDIIDDTKDLASNIAGFWDFTRGGIQTRPRESTSVASPLHSKLGRPSSRPKVSIS